MHKVECNKVVLLGDSGVGKTSICNRMAGGKVEVYGNPTIGSNYRYMEENSDRALGYAIWDTAGQERFASTTPAYIRGADVVVIVCDTVEKTSVDNLTRWFEIKQNNAPDAKTVLVMNKNDHWPDGNMIAAFLNTANELGVDAMRMSALHGEGINELDQLISAHLKFKLDVKGKNIIDLNASGSLDKKKGCSC